LTARESRQAAQKFTKVGRNLPASSTVYISMAALDAPPPALPPSLLAGMSDHTLAGLIAAGSDDAFAALDERYRRRLVRFARGFVPGGIPDAEDAVQEAMVRAVRALRAGSRPDAVGPWLHRIARNCALDLTASRRRHPVVELADHAHPVAEDAVAAVERRMGVRGLVADVGALPATQRSALVLRELEGLSYADIADELDVTVPAVKSLLVRARQGLKRARDDRRVAALLPFPLFSRIAERVTALWEPVAATATPKVACVAVVVAASIPAVSPTTPAPAPASHAAAPVAAVPVLHEKLQPPAPTQRTPAESSAAIEARLHTDCGDGTIDGAFPQKVLRAALGRSDAGAEYGDCHRALLQATA
jgi:RNA polymerase sigma factor (sigma-70 family)